MGPANVAPWLEQVAGMAGSPRIRPKLLFHLLVVAVVSLDVQA
jgi:hypothetical protein